ncbi:MAG: hypothetical protein IIV72_05380 [Alistipes sp.]|nr:hypothetical protein [Alistipes sp.]
MRRDIEGVRGDEKGGVGEMSTTTQGAIKWETSLHKGICEQCFNKIYPKYLPFPNLIVPLHPARANYAL